MSILFPQRRQGGIIIWISLKKGLLMKRASRSINLPKAPIAKNAVARIIKRLKFGDIY